MNVRRMNLTSKYSLVRIEFSSAPHWKLKVMTEVPQGLWLPIGTPSFGLEAVAAVIGADDLEVPTELLEAGQS